MEVPVGRDRPRDERNAEPRARVHDDDRLVLHRDRQELPEDPAAVESGLHVAPPESFEAAGNAHERAGRKPAHQRKTGVRAGAHIDRLRRDRLHHAGHLCPRGHRQQACRRDQRSAARARQARSLPHHDCSRHRHANPWVTPAPWLSASRILRRRSCRRRAVSLRRQSGRRVISRRCRGCNRPSATWPA
jgi:hypothetical protein